MRQMLTGTVIICLALATGWSIAPAQQARTTADLPMSEVMDREIIIELDATRGAKSASAFCSANGLQLQRTRDLSYATYQVVRVPEGEDYFAVLASLEADPQVKSAGPNVIKRVSTTLTNDPLLLNTASTVEEGLTAPHATNNQYALLLTGAPEFWDKTRGDSRVVVAVLDTGINFDHEELDGQYWINADEIAGNGVDDDSNGYIDDYRGYDFSTISSGGDNDPSDPATKYISHGNATSSIVAAAGNNNAGIAGVASGARVMVCRVGTDSLIGVDAEIAAIDYAINNGAKVISMSFGGESGGPTEEQAIDRAWNAGLYVVAASGNIGSGNRDGDTWLVDLPAGFTNCVAVGATTIFPSQTVSGSTQVIEETLAATYSKTGPETEIVAPGTHILAAGRVDGTYSNLAHQFTGTSAATPLVAGFAALLWSQDIVADGDFDMTNQDIRNFINGTAKDMGAAGRDNEYGYGRIVIDQLEPDKGDLDNDGDVDEDDLKLAVDLDGVTSSDANFIDAGDMNNDNIINHADFLSIITTIAGAESGDTDGDADVDEDDVQVLIDRFGAEAGDSNYLAEADANRDGIIDELDLFVIGRNFGN